MFLLGDEHAQDKQAVTVVISWNWPPLLHGKRSSAIIFTMKKKKDCEKVAAIYHNCRVHIVEDNFEVIF